jgi:hypothetical protein
VRRTAIPAAAYAAVFLSDTLDWLNLWHHDAGDALDESRPPAEPNRLFPRL